jgi:acetoin utilization protein AcuB
MTMDTEVKTHMTGQPVSIEPEAGALAALDLMIEHGIRHLPVLDAERRVCGVVSFDDLRAAFPMPVGLRTPLSPEERGAAGELAVGDVMTYAPETIRVDGSIEDAAGRMADLRIGCLPVVDEDGRLDGMLSETDLLHALVTLLWAERKRTAPRPARATLADSLESERDALVRQLAAYGRHEQELTATRREGGLDVADEGSVMEEGQLTERLADMAARRLRAIEHALERQERGELTTCERCGGAIAEARLRALPSATHCIRCTRELEAGR